MRGAALEKFDIFLVLGLTYFSCKKERLDGDPGENLITNNPDEHLYILKLIRNLTPIVT